MRIPGLLLLTAVFAMAQGQRPADTFDTKTGPVKITVVRHASLMIEAGGKVIHVDPWSQGNYDGLPKADLILLTDVHGDHLDPESDRATAEREHRVHRARGCGQNGGRREGDA